MTCSTSAWLIQYKEDVHGQAQLISGIALVGGFSLLPYVNSQENVYHESCRGVPQLPVQAQVWGQTFMVAICWLPSHCLLREHWLLLKVPVRQRQCSRDPQRDNRLTMVFTVAGTTALCYSGSPNPVPVDLKWIVLWKLKGTGLCPSPGLPCLSLPAFFLIFL